MQKCVVKKRLTYKYKNCTKLVQRLLGIKEDGLCGPQTADAIKNFQKKNNLDVDSCCGLQTWKKLLGIN
jgi:peptidoglycan hydrolase-like protein with peptidoglycan-binding domain